MCGRGRAGAGQPQPPAPARFRFRSRQAPGRHLGRRAGDGRALPSTTATLRATSWGSGGGLLTAQGRPRARATGWWAR